MSDTARLQKQQQPNPAPSPTAVPPYLSFDQRAIIDARGRIEASIAPLRAQLRAAEALDKEIRGWAKQYPPDQPVNLEGDFYIAVLGMAGEQTRIPNLWKLYLRIKVRKFVAMASVSLEKLRAAVEAGHITEQQMQDLTARERTGPRSLRLVQKA